MAKIKEICILITLCFIFLLAGCTYNPTEENKNSDYVYMGKDYIHHLTNDYCIGVMSTYNHDFLYLPTWQDGTYSESNKILNNVYIYKYGCSKDNKYIFIHYYILSDEQEGRKTKINCSYSYVEKDVLYLYNVNDDEQITFSSRASYYSYCDRNNIDFETFYFPAAGESDKEKRIYAADDLYIADRGIYRGQGLVYKNKEILYGFIDRYMILDDSRVLLHFQMTEHDYDAEYQDEVNTALKLDSNFKGGRHFVDLFASFKIKYDGYVLFNSATNEITEFASKGEVKDYLKKSEINGKWDKI